MIVLRGAVCGPVGVWGSEGTKRQRAKSVNRYDVRSTTGNAISRPAEERGGEKAANTQLSRV